MTAKARDEAIAYLTPRHRDLVISSQSGNQLRAVMTDARLSEAREYAVQQNINILRNRVNQLGRRGTCRTASGRRPYCG
ncbi:protein-export membrane protein SecD [Salmonella enterica subsp. enterica]|uniref:Protein-export membrane protein SecD n=1 Tax=Salmonella enterica I TaxID=59201 RepID=A0A379V2F5_SALET|nr:protein-export membrane protein SecD [Salmonella enterica subsp. enterica]